MRPAWLGSFCDYYRLILAIGTFIADFGVSIAPVIILVGIVKDNISSPTGDRMKGCSYPCMLLLDNGSRNISLNPLSYRWEIIVLSSYNTLNYRGGKAQDSPICIAFSPERFQVCHHFKSCTLSEIIFDNHKPRSEIRFGDFDVSLSV